MSAPLPPSSRGFSYASLADEHLCDHVLTRPEAPDWAVVRPGDRALADPADDAALRRVAASSWGSRRCPEAVALCDKYLGALRQAIDDALRLGFWWEHCQGRYREWFGLGLSGVYVIWDSDVIKTGYLPANSRYPPAEPPTPRTVNPLPRRNPAERLRPPPPDAPRRGYELFKIGLEIVSRLYEEAYWRGKISQAGSGVFVTRPPRIGRWQELLTGRGPRQETDSGRTT
jgi:hypothetical protein